MKKIVIILLINSAISSQFCIFDSLKNSLKPLKYRFITTKNHIKDFFANQLIRIIGEGVQYDDFLLMIEGKKTEQKSIAELNNFISYIRDNLGFVDKENLESSKNNLSLKDIQLIFMTLRGTESLLLLNLPRYPSDAIQAYKNFIKDYPFLCELKTTNNPSKDYEECLKEIKIMLLEIMPLNEENNEQQDLFLNDKGKKIVIDKIKKIFKEITININNELKKI